MGTRPVRVLGHLMGRPRYNRVWWHILCLIYLRRVRLHLNGLCLTPEVSHRRICILLRRVLRWARSRWFCTSLRSQWHRLKRLEDTLLRLRRWRRCPYFRRAFTSLNRLHLGRTGRCRRVRVLVSRRSLYMGIRRRRVDRRRRGNLGMLSHCRFTRMATLRTGQ